MRCRVLVIVCAMFGLAAPVRAAAGVPRHFAGDHLVRAHLFSENLTVVRGTAAWLAVELEPSPGWHIYWRNPGDSGRAPEISWKLPRGVSVGAISWPAPERLVTGGVTTYVYEHRTTLLVPLTIGRDARIRRDAAVGAGISWFVCSNVCIPGSGYVSTQFTIAAGGAAKTNYDGRGRFAAARSGLPRAAPFEATFTSDPQRLHISVPVTAFAGERVTNAYFFPSNATLIKQSAPQRVAIGERFSLALERNGAVRSMPSRIDGVLVVDGIGRNGRREHRDYALGADPATIMMAEPSLSLVAALVLAFAGGLILNVMPCVFPVLSFKALGAITSSAANRRRTGAAAYAAGVLASCSALGLGLLALRAQGNALGWGFQFQSPLFVALLALLLLALALAMSGVAEIVIPLPGPLAHRSGEHGALGAFIDGALVALVASSCTAPFMGAALGFALAASAPVALGVFIALGVGLALPYVVVLSVPAVAARLPRPGPWMLVARRLFAFPLYGSVAWLAWVLSAQVGRSALLAFLAALVCVGFAVSAFGSAQLNHVWRRGWLSCGVAGFVVALALVAPIRAVPRDAKQQPVVQAALGYEPFTTGRLRQLRCARRPVFVDITAAWCITCQVNDRLALDRPEIVKRFAGLHVALLKADWTNQDARISAYLEQFGRSGVPLYVYYRPSGTVEVWPQLLTVRSVLERLNHA